MQFIALFLPGFIGCTLFNKIEANIEGILKFLCTYFIFIIGTNLFSMFTVSYVLGLDGVVGEALESFSFFMVYTVMSCLYSIAGANIAKIINNNFSKRG